LNPDDDDVGTLSIQVILVNTETAVSNDDKATTKLKEWMDNSLFPKLPCISANDWSMHNGKYENSELSAANLEKDILRFVQVKDRYSALSSLLLKRWVFFQATCHLDLDDPAICPSSFPLVELPRTRHKKPYIPSLTTQSTNQTIANHNDEWFPFSISHQYPFVGLAHAAPKSFRLGALLLGVDIVVFDPYNPRLYQNVSEFVHVFLGSFASSEQAILRNLMKRVETDPDREPHLLREVYLMWSVKEAYTKALGLGLGFDFSSFATHFEDDTYETLWDELLSLSDRSATDGVLVRRGRISFADHRPDEHWMFAFTWLWDQKSGDHESHTPETARGCCCVCWKSSNTSPVELNVQWKSISELVPGIGAHFNL